jgi:type I restriction enzyme S subunit
VKAGWEVKALGEICRLINGRAYKKPELLADGKYPVLRVGNFFTNNHWYYSDLELDENKYCDDGDLLYAWSASFGPRIWQGGKVIFHYHIWKVEPLLEELDQAYLYYFFDWDKDRIKEEQGAGATMIHVSKKSMDARPIPLPPLEEQKQIVAVLDAAFEGLTRARTHVETNLQNARELFESVLQHSFSHTESWETAELNEHVKFVDYRGKTPPKRPQGVRLITAKNVKRGYIQRNPEEFIDADAYEGWMTRGFPEKGDVLFTTEAPLANVAQLDTDEKVVIGQRLITMKANKRILDCEFLGFALMSPQMREKIISQGTGATVLGIKAKLLKVIPLHFPKSLAEQRDIAKRCREASANMDGLQSIFNKKLQDLDDLRQSLLQKAFAGELT